jgi:hypothetical protein
VTFLAGDIKWQNALAVDALICHHVSHIHVILVHIAITLHALQQQLYFNNKKLDVANF